MLHDHSQAQETLELTTALQGVLQPTGSAHGLPSRLYTDDAVLRDERERLFAQTWSAIAFASDIPQSGDVVPIHWLGQPLVVLRDKKGHVRVFHNVCSHRGRQIVDSPCHVHNGLRCPYHFWHYDLDGRLKGTPHFGGAHCHHVDGFDKSRHGLTEVACGVWCDIVFINMAGDGPAFAEFIAPLQSRWAKYWGTEGPESLVAGGQDSRITMTVAANWKLAVENYCESYHLPMVHPGLNSYSRLEDHYIIVEEDGVPFSGQGTSAYNFAETAGITLPSVAQWPQELQREAEYVSLYPNVLLGIQVDHFFVVLLEPLNQQQTREHIRLYYVGEQAATGADYTDARSQQAKAWETVFTEDIAMVEGLQRGRSSPACIGGVFSPVQDIATHHFHRWIARRLYQTLAANDQAPSPVAPALRAQQT